MAHDDVAAEVAIWVDPAWADRCAAVLHGMGTAVRPICVGGPRGGEVDELAWQFGCRREDDPRRMLNDHPARFLLLATESTPPAAELRGALAAGTHLVALEPVAGDLVEWASLELDDPAELPAGAAGLAPLPLFESSPGWRSSADPMQVVGELRSATFLAHGRPENGSLLARLLDAWMSLLLVIDLPQSIDASLATPIKAASQKPQAVTGHLHAHARLADGRAALVHASDRAAVCRRVVHLVGDAGQLRATDLGYELIEAGGQVIDQRHAGEQRLDWNALIVEQWRRILDGLPPAGPQMLLQRLAQAMACCQACLLSCRTGQPESPRHLLRLHLPQRSA